MQLTNISYGDEPFDTGFRLFVDMNEQRFRSVSAPTYVVKLTQPVYLNSTNIYVSDGSVLGTPDPALVIPGIIHINGERIVYYEKEGNRLGRLRRGVGGTGIPQVHLINSDVEDAGPIRYNNEGQFKPDAEYRVTPTSITVNEGTTVRFRVTTKNVTPGTRLYWTNNGTSQIQDFVGYDANFLNRGDFLIGGDYNAGEAYIDITPRLDLTSEGNETIIFNVRTGGFNGPIVATSETVTINDIGIIPTYDFTPRLSTIAEGQSIIFDIVTEGIADGTTLYWTNEGSSSENDFVVQSSSGPVTVSGSYREATGFVRLDTVRNFGYSTGKSIVLNLRENSPTGPILTTANVVYIADLPNPQYDVRATIISTGQYAGNTQSITTNEGQSVRFDFLTVGVDPGNFYFYQIAGTSSSADYTSSAGTTGFLQTTGTIFGASSNVVVNILEDLTTENGPPETLIFNVYSSASYDPTSFLAGPVTVNINDTSVAPSITVTPSVTTTMEGSPVTFNITTDGIQPGSTLYWTNTGTTDVTDFDNYPPNTVTVGGTYRAGTASVTFNVKDDLTPLAPDPEEGQETIIFRVYISDPNGTPPPIISTTPITVTIDDTSKVTTTTTEPPSAVPIPGQALVNFFNGDFEITSPKSTYHIPGWSIYKPGEGGTAAHLRLDGFSNILGWPTPNDPTPRYLSATSPYGDQDSPVAMQFEYALVDDSISPFGGKKVLRLYSSGTSVPFGIVRGPYVVADNPIICNPGDKIYFHWKAENGGDDFDVFAYLLDESNGNTVLLLNESSYSVGSTTTNWARVEKVIGPTESGTYKFVFICGTYDFTGFTGVGASLYLDNIDKVSATPPPDPWTLVVTPPVDIVGGAQVTITLNVPNGQPAQTVSWFIVDPGTLTAFNKTGITGANLGAAGNQPVLVGPSSVAITINTNEISGDSQSFQMVAMTGDLSGTLLVRSQTVNIESPPTPVSPTVTITGPATFSSGSNTVQMVFSHPVTLNASAQTAIETASYGIDITAIATVNPTTYDIECTRGGIAYAVVDSGASVMSGSAGLTRILTASGTTGFPGDDSVVNITLPFDIAFPVDQSTVVSGRNIVVGTNCFIALGAYSGNGLTPSAVLPPIPAIFIGARDSGAYGIWHGSLDGDQTYIIRFEGTRHYSDNVFNRVWEVVFYASDPTKFTVRIDPTHWDNITEGASFIKNANTIIYPKTGNLPVTKGQYFTVQASSVTMQIPANIATHASGGQNLPSTPLVIPI